MKLKFEIDIVPRSVPECWAECCQVSVRRVTSASVGWWPYSARRTMRRGPYTRSITLSVTKGKTHSIIERKKVWLQISLWNIIKLLIKKYIIYLYPIAQHWTNSSLNIKMCFSILSPWTLSSFCQLSLYVFVHTEQVPCPLQIIKRSYNNYWSFLYHYLRWLTSLWNSFSNHQKNTWLWKIAWCIRSIQVKLVKKYAMME